MPHSGLVLFYLTPLPAQRTCPRFHFGVHDATLTIGDIVPPTTPPCPFRVRVPTFTFGGLYAGGGLFGAMPVRVFQARPYPEKQHCGLSKCAVRDLATGAMGGKGEELGSERMFSFFHLCGPAATACVEGPAGLCLKTDRHEARKMLNF